MSVGLEDVYVGSGFETEDWVGTVDGSGVETVEGVVEEEEEPPPPHHHHKQSG